MQSLSAGPRILPGCGFRPVTTGPSGLHRRPYRTSAQAPSPTRPQRSRRKVCWAWRGSKQSQATRFGPTIRRGRLVNMPGIFTSPRRPMAERPSRLRCRCSRRHLGLIRSSLDGLMARTTSPSPHRPTALSIRSGLTHATARERSTRRGSRFKRRAESEMPETGSRNGDGTETGPPGVRTSRG